MARDPFAQRTVPDVQVAIYAVSWRRKGVGLYFEDCWFVFLGAELGIRAVSSQLIDRRYCGDEEALV